MRASADDGTDPQIGASELMLNETGSLTAAQSLPLVPITMPAALTNSPYTLNLASCAYCTLIHSFSGKAATYLAAGLLLPPSSTAAAVLATSTRGRTVYSTS